MAGRRDLPDGEEESGDPGEDDLDALIELSRPRRRVNPRAPPPQSEGRSPPPPPSPETEATMPWDETPRILDEIDRMYADLRRRPPARPGSPESASRVPIKVPVASTDDPEAEGAAVSPYLEERLQVARNSMATLGRELRGLELRWQGIRDAAQLLEEELGNATLEAEFLRSAGPNVPGGALATRSPSGPAPVPLPNARANVRSSSRAPRSAPFAGFTAAQYNRTVSDLRSRRRRLAWWTVGAAAAISGVLVTLQLVAREPMPSIWLALLPIIWMVPVPFFLISFLSTQRLLRRQPLDLPGDP